jgi:pimeloyl-ACP methyl ester carboxylesterase
MNVSRSEFVEVNGIRLHVRRWGAEDAPILFMLHGWMDVAASFQFVVDALAGNWQVVAPDMRGFGLSDWPAASQGGGSYWFYDYLADLEGLLSRYAPEGEVNLVGHSMGANISCLYAGARPERVRRVVDLEGFGMPAATAVQAPKRVRAWLDELREPPRLRHYRSLEDVAARLVKTNPRLSAPRAAFLAQHWARPDGEGGYMLLADAAHKMRSPLLYRLDEVTAIWSQVRAKVLHVEAAGSETLVRLAGEVPIAEFKTRFEAFPDWREHILDDAGHMVHHDQPEIIAQLIEAFCE